VTKRVYSVCGAFFKEPRIAG